MTAAVDLPRCSVDLGESGGNGLGLALATERIPSRPGFANFCAVAAGDIDKDGDMDLYFVDYDAGFPNSYEDRLWLNDGTGFFADVTDVRLAAGAASSGLRGSAWAMSRMARP